MKKGVYLPCDAEVYVRGIHDKNFKNMNLEVCSKVLQVILRNWWFELKINCIETFVLHQEYFREHLFSANKMVD